MNLHITNTILDLAGKTRGEKYRTLLADPPWRFINRTGKVAPEHRRLTRYDTLSTDEICQLPVSEMAEKTAHLYLWVPNALLPEGLKVMEAWGFQYKSNIVWHKSQGWRLRWSWSGVLLPQRHRAFALRRARQERPHRGTGPQPGQLHVVAQARTLAQAR